MEISAARLLAPYFGTSSFVWTNIIGVVLVALSLGYYYGGRLADKRPQIGVLLQLILASGLIFLLIPWVVQPLANIVTINTLSFQSASVIIFVSSLIVTSVLFAFPLLVLGMTSPFIIKLYSLRRQDIGNVAGSISAVSTLGSILGTFLPTLWFIPTLGTRLTITIFAMLLIVMAASALVVKKIWLLFLFILLIPLATVNASGIKSTPGLVAEDESVYQYIQVVKDTDDTHYLIYNEGGGVQSVYNKNKVLTHVDYFNYFAVLPYLINSQENRKILNIGLAGGSLSRLFDHYLTDDVRIDGVEIDQKVIDMARTYFDLDSQRTHVHNQDGRMFLQYTDERYDLIVVDAYSQELYIPWTLTTREFWSLVGDHLQPGGVVAINVNATSPDSELLQSIKNTMLTVFDHVYETKIARNESWNYMISASQDGLPFTDLAQLVTQPDLTELAFIISQETRQVAHDDRFGQLTDDRAPIEFMTDKMIFRYITEGAP